MRHLFRASRPAPNLLLSAEATDPFNRETPPIILPLGRLQNWLSCRNDIKSWLKWPG